LKIEEIKKYLETKKNEANEEFQNAKNGSSEKTLNNGRFLAFYEILEWIEEKQREERNEKFHVKGEKTR
jgi:predicted Holliday junction resolvase-like endonuclease